MNSAAKTIALNDKFAHCSLNNHEQNEQSHMGFGTREELPYFAHREWPTDRRRAGGDLAHATHCAKFRLIEVSIGTYSFPYGHAFGVDDAAISAEERSTVMLFERNDRRVCEAFRNGEFDYVDAAGELSETDFFRAIASKQVLEKLAATYPSPAKKHDVPLWVYIASNISMRFHGVHQFNAYCRY